ncbi:MAG: tail fiber domain-containing protein, partial [Bacteroidota bacterium]
MKTSVKIVNRIYIVAFLTVINVLIVNGQTVGISYQAVAVDGSKSQGFGKDSQGKVLANQPVNLRFSVRERSEDGTVVYQESHETQTDIFGIFRVVIGRGSELMSSSLDDLRWGEVIYFLEVEIDLGEGFIRLGTEELLGSPYALGGPGQRLDLVDDELVLSNGERIDLSQRADEVPITPTNGLVSTDVQSALEELSNRVINNDNQDLSLSGNTLSLSNDDSPVDLSSYLDNTDAQTLTLTGSNLTIDGGNSVDLSSITTNTDNPTIDQFNITSNTLNLSLESDGVAPLSVDLSPYLDNTDAQNLSLSGNTLSLTGDATSVDLSGYANTDAQDLTLSGNSLSLTNDATTVNLSGYLDNTDDQTVDQFNITSNTLNLSLESDGVAPLTVDLAPYLEIPTGGTNGQVLTRNGSGGVSWSNSSSSTFSNNLAVTSNGSGQLVNALDRQAFNVNSDDINIGNASTDQTDFIGNVDFNDGLDVDNGNFTIADGATATTINNDDINLGNTSTDDIDLTGVVDVTGNTTLNGSLTIDGDGAGPGDPYILPAQDGNVNQVLTTNGSGTISWGTLGSGAGAFNTLNNVTFNSSGSYANDDFVFGGGTLANDAGTTDDDSRFFFDKSLSAFRAGTTLGTQWDGANVGQHSVGLGLDPRATATGAVAIGTEAYARSHNSVAIGRNTLARGVDAVSIGAQSIVNDAAGSMALMGGFVGSNGNGSLVYGVGSSSNYVSSVVLGSDATSGGEYATAIGRSLVSGSYGEIALGYFNTSVSGNTGSNLPGDRLFVIGNGDDNINRSDALVMLKNGSTILNGQLTLDGDNAGVGRGYTLPAQDGSANQVLMTDGSGTISWGSGAAAFYTLNNVTSNSPGSYANDDFVFGSGTLANNAGTTDDDSRFFFDKSLSAFRVGTALSNQWNGSNVGQYSVGLGLNPQATAIGAVAIGTEAYARSDNSVAIGRNTQARGADAVSIGAQSLVNDAAGSMALMGGFVDSNGDGSLVYGVGSSSNYVSSVVLGSDATSGGQYATAIGRSLVAGSYGEIALGYFNTSVSGNTGSNLPGDRLFVIGNGDDNMNRSDALVILKNGNTTLNGDFHATGTITSSDRRLKKDIQPLEGSLDKVLALKGVHYKWNGTIKHADTTSIRTGFIAQEVEEVLPELVAQRIDGFKGVNYTEVIPH